VCVRLARATFTPISWFMDMTLAELWKNLEVVQKINKEDAP
jgi:hypothetical protein